MTRHSVYAQRTHAHLLWVCLGFACTGSLGNPSGPDDGKTGGASGDDGSGRTPDEGGYDPDNMGGLADLPAASTRAARLTHTQWQNTVRDAFTLSSDEVATFAEALRADATQSGFLFDNLGEALSVDEALWAGYRRAALDVAERVAGDDNLRGRLYQGDAAAFVRTLGLHLYRRPLEQSEVDEHVALFQAAPGLYEGLADDVAGVRLVIEAMLQSPLFVYRVEHSEEVAGKVIPLDGYEVATRLSYFLWNSLPDDALFDAAGSGALTRASEVSRQVERMLDDPRAADVLQRFHEQVFETGKLASIAPSPAFFPDVPATLGASARGEQERFVKDVVFGGELGLRELLTSTSTYVNRDLAAIYRLDGSFGDDFVPVTLDAGTRSGILTQVGFLAAHATSVDPDPIHRGVFVARRIACMPLPPPPNNVPPLPAIEGKTNRERVVAHTEVPGSNCAGCHSTTINPLGFPFEHYDAVGAYREEDSGKPVDSSSEPYLDGARVKVNDALELTSALAESDAVHACYLSHWLEYAHGRAQKASDKAQIARLAEASLAGDLPLKKLFVALTASESFLTRSTEELP